MNNIIEINKLTKNYGKNRGIRNITFNVQEGEIFGFIGPNGAGKSTLIRTLLGLQKQSGGTATIFGNDISEYANKIASDIGYLPSEVSYYDNMKVKDLLNYSASFYDGDYSDRINYLANRLELDINRKIEDLSYGNRKKVGIVQGLLHSPKLIILDEPTGGLDPLMQQTFFEILEEENKRGATIFFSSHILSEVQRLCKRVAIIKEGELVEVRDVARMREENYKKIEVIVSDPVELEAIEGLAAVTNFEVTDNICKFMYKGNMNELITCISVINIADIRIEEPSLEEIFLHYYK